MTQLPTVTDLVLERFGGINKLARALGKPVSTVQGWKESGTIPLRNWPDIEALAIKEGFYDLSARWLGEAHANQEVRRAQEAARLAANDDKSVKAGAA